jgi:thiol-disulfide isomerase/thioredoxin
VNLRLKIFAACLAVACCSASTRAAPLSDAQAVPHLDASGRDGYRDFLDTDAHRAFVIAPGGAWAWKADAASADAATREALLACQHLAGRPCVPYASDDRVTFDSQNWPSLWGPYQRRAEAGKAPVGKDRGHHFFDLAIKSPAGQSMKLSDLRGKVTVLHFWGSWCPPCRREMPQLQKLHQALGATADVQLVLLQVRENFSTASQWALQQHLSLPLHDSGVKERGNKFLTLSNNETIADRDLAISFPTTYILDKHGLVVFSHAGPIEDWSQYLPFLHDVAEKSGK